MWTPILLAKYFSVLTLTALIVAPALICGVLVAAIRVFHYASVWFRPNIKPAPLVKLICDEPFVRCVLDVYSFIYYTSLRLLHRTRDRTRGCVSRTKITAFVIADAGKSTSAEYVCLLF